MSLTEWIFWLVFSIQTLWDVCRQDVGELCLQFDTRWPFPGKKNLVLRTNSKPILLGHVPCLSNEGVNQMISKLSSSCKCL